MEKKIIVVLGPTASGKTTFAARLAQELNTEIISGDSRQVYRGMDIGTGKDIEEYTVGGKPIHVHLIDIAEAGETYDLSRYIRDFHSTYNQILERGIIPVLCGGSGMYLESVLMGYNLPMIPVNEELRGLLIAKNPVELERMFRSLPSNQHLVKADLSTKKRLIRAIEMATWLNENEFVGNAFPRLKPFIIGIDPGKEERRRRITLRLEKRLHAGMVRETEELRQRVADEQLIRYGLEYKLITQFLRGEYAFDEMKEKLNTLIQQFAKRQMTYFRKMEKAGLEINWISGDDSYEECLIRVKNFISNAN